MNTWRKEGELEYYTPSELVEKYPAIVNVGWSAVKIGMFYHAGLLRGKYVGRDTRNVIEEQSFIELMAFFNDVNEKVSKKVKRIE